MFICDLFFVYRKMPRAFAGQGLQTAKNKSNFRWRTVSFYEATSYSGFIVVTAYFFKFQWMMRIGLFDLMNCQVNLYRFFLIMITGIRVVKFSDGVFVTEYLLNKDLKKALLIIKG